MFGLNKKIHKSVRDDSIVEVTESNGIRSLHLGTVTIQSSMKVKSPFELQLTYTRGMMGFLLFSSKVKNVLTIGLGGGSVPKYIWQFCPTISQMVVEINAQIISTARSHFFVPNNDERLNIIEGDGLAHLASNPNSADVLMIDAFDAHGIPPDFCSQDFFDRCETVLTKDGIFVINLWGSDKNFDVYLRRIEQSFADKVLMLPTGKPGNIVVFGLKASFKHLHNLKMTQLHERAKLLETDHKIEFTTFVEKLFEHNQNHQNILLSNAE
jgi:spermidine synthase